jgi:hypothetical protein
VAERACRPYSPARRPGGRPSRKPRYRVLVHRQYRRLWDALIERVGLQSAQQFYDYVANMPGQPPSVGTTTVLMGRAALPTGPGFSRTIHYEISGAGRINFQFNDAYSEGARGDPHPIVRILTIDLGSH